MCALRRRYRLRERAEDLEAQVKERDVLVEELVLSNQAQLERNETLTVQNEDLRGESNEVVSGAHRFSGVGSQHDNTRHIAIFSRNFLDKSRSLYK